MNPHAAPASYLDATRSVLFARGPLAWLTTLDHKRLGVMYLVVIGVALVAAAVARLALQNEPAATTVAAFLFLVPAVPAVLGTFFLPLQLGQHSAALPRVSLAGFWLFVLGAIGIAAALATADGGKVGLVPRVAVALVLGASAFLAGANVIATTARAVVHGVPASRITLFAWSLCASSIALIVGFVALVGLATLVVLAHAHVPFLVVSHDVEARILAHPWTYLAPCGTLALAPALGLVTDVFAAFAGRRPAGYGFVATALTALAWLGLVEWAFPILESTSMLKVSFSTALLSGALAIVVVCWVATLHGGRIVLSTPLFWALGCLFQLAIGAPAGMLLGIAPTSAWLQGTLFEAGYRSYALSGGIVLGFGAGLHYFWPKITGRQFDERLARPTFALVFVGLQMTFLSQMVEGLFPDIALGTVSSYGMVVLAAGGVASLLVLAVSLRLGARAPSNPWGAQGFEWTVASPPPLDNFVLEAGEGRERVSARSGAVPGVSPTS